MREWLPERLPEDIPAEASLLATCSAPGMAARAAEVVSGLREEDFVHPAHRAWLRALRAVLSRGDEVHALSLKQQLADQGQLGEVGGFAGLTELMASEEVGRPEQLAALVRRKAAQRRLVMEGARLVREASDEAGDPTELARGAAARIMEQGGDGKGRSTPSTAGAAMRAAVANCHSSDGPGIPVPFDRLNGILGGLHPGNLTIIGGRPGLGKTSLALQLALDSARRGHRTGFWSLEMSQDEVCDRLSAIMGQLSPGWARRRLGDHEAERAEATAAELDRLPLDICDDAGTTPSMVRAACATAAAKGNPYRMVVFDFLQLAGDDDPDRARRQNESVRVGAISRSLKITAKDFNLSMVALSQLNREVEGRGGGAPRLSDLRDSGSIEQDADQVLFVHRKWVDGSPDLQGQILVPKNRHGRTAGIAVAFSPERLAFSEMVYETAPAASGPAPTMSGWEGMDLG